MNNGRMATVQDIETIRRITDFAMFRLRSNRHILIDTGDGCLFNFEIEEVFSRQKNPVCAVKVSVCKEHASSPETRGPALSALGFEFLTWSDSMLEFSAEVPFMDCKAVIHSLLLVGVDAGETRLQDIELLSISPNREAFPIEKYEFFQDEEGGEKE